MMRSRRSLPFYILKCVYTDPRERVLTPDFIFFPKIGKIIDRLYLLLTQTIKIGRTMEIVKYNSIYLIFWNL